METLKFSEKYQLTLLNKMPTTTIIEKNKITSVIKQPSVVKSTIKQPVVVKTLIKNGKGDNGLSAYQIAVKNGFVGSEAEWLLSLKASGSVGINPQFAYDGDGNLESITYDNGAVKQFVYDENGLLYIYIVFEGTTYKKEFVYDIDGNLDHIIEGYI